MGTCTWIDPYLTHRIVVGSPWQDDTIHKGPRAGFYHIATFFCQPHIVPRLATVQKQIRPSKHCRAHHLNFSRPHAGRHMERHMRLHGNGLYPATSFPRTQVHHVAKRNHPLQGWLGRPDINNKRQCLSSGQRDIFRHRQVQDLEIAHHAPIVGGLTCLSSGGKSHCTSALTTSDGRRLTRLPSHSYPVKCYGCLSVV